MTVSAGRTASPSAWPRLATASARPRRARNQRPMATMATWLIMPWPQKRRPAIRATSTSAEAFSAMPAATAA